MKITIIGWYGTETIGDRAILAGLISLFNKTYQKFEIKLGSLHPFFTERTINEDYNFYNEIIKKELKIDIFNSKNAKELNNAILDSDLVVMGGGPLMDLNELFMVEYAFKKAKKSGVKTALLGCGIGPLFQRKYKKSVLEIIKKSNLVILRDVKSKENLEEIFQESNQVFNMNSIYTSYDPAVECCLEFMKQYKREAHEYIAVNLREFPLEYNKDRSSKNINDSLKFFIKNLSEQYPNREIKLIPMHYFHIGGDDRIFLNSIALDLKKSNLNVQNTNLTLKETAQIYQNAFFNVGMRFHSILLQMILNGNNYIFDYTEPRKGKIYGFLQDIDKKNFYVNRYISLQENMISTNIIQSSEEKFSYSEEEILQRLDIYIKKLNALR